MEEPATSEIRTKRLVLSPLVVSDAVEMVAVLADQSLHAFTGGEPPSLTTLTARYEAQVVGSGRSDEVWYNWIVRNGLSGVAVGFVQATVESDSADLAWVIGVPWQGRGFASEAAAAMRLWLANAGVGRFEAHVHPDHEASGRVAAAIGLAPTGQVDDEGEEVWASEPERSVGEQT